MKIASLVARILLALIFIAAGVSGFVLVQHPPQMPPGLAAQFQDVFFRSYYVLFVDAVYIVAGVLLLVDRYVPLALVALAGILFNIFVFHITMQPIGLPAPIVVTALWFLVAWPRRAAFAPLLAQKTAP